MLLNAAKRDAYDKVVAWLRHAGRPAADHDRHVAPAGDPGRPARPAVPDADPRSSCRSRPSSTRSTRCITTYLDEIRRPASAIFVLDMSGSMEGERLDPLKPAMKALTGTDTSLTGQFSRFRTHEEVTIITFSSTSIDAADIHDRRHGPQLARA